MIGLMQDRPLGLPHIFHRAETLFADKMIVTATASGEQRATYGECFERVRKLAAALDRLQVPADARVGTLCWNTQTHLELYFAVPCSGRVLHTINIRLFPDQLAFVVADAHDDVVFVERSLVPALWQVADRIPSVRHIVVIDDGSDEEVPDDPRLMDYETLLATGPAHTGRFVVDDENSAATLCYTSGTTGDPKGVLYSHRSTALHSLASLASDVLAIGERDCVQPVVPMFHVNAWGLPYTSVLAGADIVLPGTQTAPDELLAQIENHRVSMTAGVPTIWMGALPLLHKHDLSSLRMVLCGGAAVPQSLSEGWRAAIGLPITQAWGMTETSPICTIATLRREHESLADEQRARVRATQGRPVPLFDLRLVDPETGAEQPWDGSAAGELQASGPWIAAGYLNGSGQSAFTVDGWLRTGDIATVDPSGYLSLVDRTKDLVKSGGEWISSVALENHIMAHVAVVEAAVVAKPDPRWSERPVAFVVAREDAQITADDVLEHLRPLVPKWWLPDEVHFIEALPKTGTGKFAKRMLRARFDTGAVEQS
ncbi:long-chain fatty acid--CoA ligase [Streptomyces malaysiensis]|uniref:Long-chain fatty acid--CoA ligase n=1 Tax=Streptomyces malaysiensis subsp. samsunensis TaxID=459658 RepID=A0A9X2RYE2_STRMQ|nr:long-chain fatty acid--CoA ligase [Streptomyces samsunensis]MCQ8835481.1 long-chain fatty acid--CoA ligase [Streptomyces samsunensis]